MACESIAPMIFTPAPAPPTLVGAQTLPLYIYDCEAPLAIVTPCIIKLVEPMLLIYTTRPATVFAVGVGSVSVRPEVV